MLIRPVLRRKKGSSCDSAHRALHTSMISLSILVAVGIDWLAGEPRRWHPLVGFGALAAGVEKRLNLKHPEYVPWFAGVPRRGKLCGVLGLLLLCLPLPLLWWFLVADGALGSLGVLSVSSLLEVTLLYLSIGHRSLWDHGRPIVDALEQQDEDLARQLTSRIVSRDPEALDIEVSAIESVLENGNDALFGALFWFVIAGGAGALCYRLVNTLDATWGYRTSRYCDFGWAAAKFDDLLNYLPARCTALSYALLADTQVALRCWQAQAAAHASPNGGPVITAGAGGLGVILGGPTRYQGVWHNKPLLGEGQPPRARDIVRALRLVTQTLMLWIILLLGADLLGAVYSQAGGFYH
ncbi:MAG: adenosylcobinamide-phosphate synthase [Motiliproteus sp.]|jgi:adenosylcobinamide-phosphate synthase